jgi:hypothetical protein
MAISVKSAAESQRLWSSRTGAAAPEYGANTPQAGSIWEANTLAAVANYGAAIRSANIEARQAAGVRRSGAQGYSSGVREKGIPRFAEGARLGAPKYGSRVSPYLQRLAGTDLPPRRTRGDPANYQRVNAVGNPLHELRLASAAAGT